MGIISRLLRWGRGSEGLSSILSIFSGFIFILQFIVLCAVMPPWIAHPLIQTMNPFYVAPLSIPDQAKDGTMQVVSLSHGLEMLTKWYLVLLSDGSVDRYPPGRPFTTFPAWHPHSW